LAGRSDAFLRVLRCFSRAGGDGWWAEGTFVGGGRTASRDDVTLFGKGVDAFRQGRDAFGKGVTLWPGAVTPSRGGVTPDGCA
jgi:hypothetical protein